MYNIYITEENGKIQEIKEFRKGSWIHVVNPSQEEIRMLISELQIEPDFINDPLDDEERSRIEKEGNNVLIIVDMPNIVHEDTIYNTYDTIPLGIIVTPDYFVTVTLKDNPVFERFVNGKVKGFFTFKKTRFALQLLYTISTYFLRYLKQINRRTDEIEDELHLSMKNKEIFFLLSLDKSLVYFTTSLKANNVVLKKLMRTKLLKLYEDDEDLLEDVIIEVEQAIEMAQTYSNILNGTMDAYASVISNNLNIVMKFLTSITIVMSLPTMVASFFGMNVPVPFENIPYAFTIILSIAALLSFITAYIFWKKKYF